MTGTIVVEFLDGSDPANFMDGEAVGWRMSVGQSGNLHLWQESRGEGPFPMALATHFYAAGLWASAIRGD